MTGENDVDAVLARVQRHSDRHELAEVERLLTPLVTPARLSALPAHQRCWVLIEWGWLHGATQRYEPARAALAAAIDLASDIGRGDLLAEALREAGLVARYEGNYPAAEEYFVRCESIAADRGDDLTRARALLLRATVAHQVHAFVRARVLLAEATEVARRCAADEQADLLVADICREQAVSARIARDFDDARALLIEAGRRYESLGRRVGLANTQRELGAICESVGDSDGARRHFATAFAAYLRAGRRLGAAVVARRLGQVDLGTEAPEPAALRRAGRRFQQALRLGGGEPTNEAATTVRLARLARLEGRLDDAERLLSVATDLVVALGEDNDVARDLSEIALQWGLVARERGDPDSAIELFRQALAPLDPATDPSAAALAHYELAFELIRADEVAQAVEHSVAAFWLNEDSGRRLRDARQRRIFYVANRDSYGLALHCAARAGDGRTALAVATAARAEALASFVRAGARLDPRLHELVTRLALTSAQDDAEDPQRDELFRQLEQSTSEQLRQSMSADRIDIDEIVGSLPPGGHALLIDVLEEDERICNRIWVPPSGEPYIDELILSDEVRDYLDGYRRAESDAVRPQDAELEQLGVALIPPPLAAVLETDASTPLVVSTGSLLGPVPLAALRINGQYLVEQAQLCTVPSLALWASLRSRPVRPGRGVLAYLDPELPGVAREERALRAALPPVDGVAAAELRACLADAARYAMVVLNAHGEPAPRRDSASELDIIGGGLAHALALASGDHLTAADLLACRLPDGVVMAACWSGHFAVETAIEPFGLPTAALIAGARWVLAGSVDIGTTPTATVLTGFYTALGAGLSPSAALAQAQRSYLRPRGRVPPGPWAGLTIIGDGHSPLPPSR